MDVAAAKSHKITVVNVKIEESASGLFFATSEDLDGLCVAHRDLDKIKEDMPNIVRLLYKRRFDLDVKVFEASSPKGDDAPNKLGAWAAITPHVAEMALAR